MSYMHNFDKFCKGLEAENQLMLELIAKCIDDGVERGHEEVATQLDRVRKENHELGQFLISNFGEEGLSFLLKGAFQREGPLHQWDAAEIIREIKQ